VRILCPNVEEISSNNAELRRRVEGTLRFECRSSADPIPFDNFSLSFAGASAVAPRASMAVGPFQDTFRIEKTINTSSGKSGGPIQRAMPIQKPKSLFVNVIGSETNGPPLVGITTDRTSQCSCGFSPPAALARTDFVVIEFATIPRLQLWRSSSTRGTFAS
jgi:hypothetical protein